MPEIFRAVRSGVEVRLDSDQDLLLRHVAGELLGVLGEPAEGPGASPGLDRLFPRAYLDPTEEKAEEDWQKMVHGDLLEVKRANGRSLLDDLDALAHGGGGARGVLRVEQAEAWLGTLNDARLVLGTRFEVDEEIDYSTLDPEDPEGAAKLTYGFLTYLTGELVDALSD
ncbi:MAG: DUF2017 domain-containing protein [Acidimicrobiia bacterium]|nr:DUF2017 domain-containing protein [Acidimicrobiia bacterium]